MRDQKKVDKKIYHSICALAQGNQFNNKQVLFESIHAFKAVRARKRSLKDQSEERKGRDRMRLERKFSREEKKIPER